jgi:hypothetical protein
MFVHCCTGDLGEKEAGGAPDPPALGRGATGVRLALPAVSNPGVAIRPQGALPVERRRGVVQREALGRGRSGQPTHLRPAAGETQAARLPGGQTDVGLE